MCRIVYTCFHIAREHYWLMVIGYYSLVQWITYFTMGINQGPVVRFQMTMCPRTGVYLVDFKNNGVNNIFGGITKHNRVEENEKSLNRLCS